MLSMDSPPPSPEVPQPVRRRSFRRFGIIFAVVLVLAIILLLLCLPSAQPQFAWLTPAQVAQASRPGPLTQLKYKLIRMVGPLMRHFPSHRPNIMITADILAQPVKLGQVAPDAPGVANSGGASAWILSPGDLLLFQQRLKASPSVNKLSSPRILTMSGGQAIFSTIRAVTLVSTNLGVITGISTNYGLTTDIKATASGDSISILLNMSDTELVGPPVTPPPPIVTNLSAVCRVRLANGGGLVISSGQTGPGDSTNYWLVISPTLVDAAGKPIKK